MKIDLSQVTRIKEQANARFGSGDTSEAVSLYSSALGALGNNAIGDLSVEVRELKGTVLANRAACFLNLKNYRACVDDCTAAIECGGAAIAKAYYRRALVFLIIVGSSIRSECYDGEFYLINFWCQWYI